MQINLHPRQMEVLRSGANEILFGGAAGGGKSFLLRAIAVALCFDNPGLQVYLFRRNYPDLISNHMSGFMSFPEMLASMVENGMCKIVENDIRFHNGSRINLRHCEYENSVIKYQGAEIHVLLIDELTHFSEHMYRYLRSRVRLGGQRVSIRWKKKLPLIVCASNPGGVGHQWVKANFIDGSSAYNIRQMDDANGGMRRQYVPAKLQDNPTLVENDPSYFQKLEGLGNPELVRAMRDGDWDIVAGAAFEKLSRSKHIIRPFEIPYWWTRFTSLDWGTAKPYAHGWFTVTDEDVVLKKQAHWSERLISKGSIIMYRELYGWNGNADQGTREESWEVARRIQSLEGREERIDYRIADSAMWSEHDGPSAAENMMNEFVRLEASCPSMERSRKGRMENYLEMRSRFAAEDGQPGFYTFENCLHFWRTLPELQLDQRHPEKGWDTMQEDHCFVAGTKILTSAGGVNIEDIKTGDFVFTTSGMKPCIALGKTGDRETVIVSLSDGSFFEATDNHPILTLGGTYCRLDQLQRGDALCLQKLPFYLKLNSHLWVKHIGCAINIFNGAVKDCIGRYGKPGMEKFHLYIMSTIRTIIDQIIQLPIFGFCTNQSTAASTWANGCLIQQGWRRQKTFFGGRGTLPQDGIKARRGENGIRKIQKDTLQKGRSISAFAKYARKLSFLTRRALSYVLALASKKTSAVTILDIIKNTKRKPVFNLSVPGPENYCLANGLVVHNCADMTAYALASRPLIMDQRRYDEDDYQRTRKKSKDADRGIIGSNTSRYS